MMVNDGLSDYLVDYIYIYMVGGAITILKKWKSMGRIIPYIMENKHVPNHQPVYLWGHHLVNATHSSRMITFLCVQRTTTRFQTRQPTVHRTNIWHNYFLGVTPTNWHSTSIWHILWQSDSLSDTFSGRYSGFLSGIYSDILSGICLGPCVPSCHQSSG